MTITPKCKTMDSTKTLAFAKMATKALKSSLMQAMNRGQYYAKLVKMGLNRQGDSLSPLIQWLVILIGCVAIWIKVVGHLPMRVKIQLILSNNGVKSMSQWARQWPRWHLCKCEHDHSQQEFLHTPNSCFVGWPIFTTKKKVEHIALIGVMVRVVVGYLSVLRPEKWVLHLIWLD